MNAYHRNCLKQQRAKESVLQVFVTTLILSGVQRIIDSESSDFISVANITQKSNSIWVSPLQLTKTTANVIKLHKTCEKKSVKSHHSLFHDQYQ